MKRIGILLLATALTLSLVACGNSNSSSASPNNTMSNHASSETLGQMIDDVIPDMDYSRLRTGLGVVSSAAESTAAADPSGSNHFTTTICALTVQPDGTIIDVRFDTVDTALGSGTSGSSGTTGTTGTTGTSGTTDTSGNLTGNSAQEIRSGRELGDEYGMRTTSGIGREWYEQIDSLEGWMRGKMVSDALAMRITEGEGMGVPDEDDLRSSVSIPVNDQLRALEKAYADAQR